MILLASNNASGKLLSSINNTATSVTLQTGQGALFPSPVSTVSYFYLAHVNPVTNLVDEIVQVTAVSGDTFTIVRGQEGTTAVAWIAGDIVGDYFTAGSFNALAQKQQVQSNLFNYATDTGVVNAYVVTLSPAPNLVNGMSISFSTANSNTTTTPTLTVNGITLSITLPGGASVSPGQIVANAVSYGYYNATGPRFELQNAQNGEIIKYGTGTVTGSGANLSASITFPTAFPNSCDHITASLTGLPLSHIWHFQGVAAQSTTGATLYFGDELSNSFSVSYSFTYMAIGH